MKILERDAYVLALITGFLYIGAYLSVLAKSVYYDIPLSMLSIDVFELTGSALIMLFIASSLITPFLFSVYYGFKVGRKVRIVFLLSIIVVFTWIAYRFTMHIFGLGVSLFICIVIFSVLMVFYFKKRGEFSDFINAGNKKEEGKVDQSYKNESISCQTDSENFTKKEVFIGGMIAMAWVFLSCFGITYMNCFDKYDYDVFLKEKPYAIISSSNDVVVAKEIINGKLCNGYYIFKVEDLKNTHISKVDISNVRAFSSS